MPIALPSRTGAICSGNGGPSGERNKNIGIRQQGLTPINKLESKSWFQNGPHSADGDDAGAFGLTGLNIRRSWGLFPITANVAARDIWPDVGLQHERAFLPGAR